MSKVTLLAEKLWIIRSVQTQVNGEHLKTQFYETPSTWNKSPMEATIFQNYEAAESHLNMMRNRDIPLDQKWADGRTEVFDIVSLYAELTHPSGNRQIGIKPD